MSYVRKPLTEEQKRRKAAQRKKYHASARGRRVVAEQRRRWRLANADKIAGYRAKRDAALPGWKREWHLSRKFGMTGAAYAAMLANQGGGCAICGATEPGGRGRYFHVDHDHATTSVRALLCNRCNRALGLFEDDHRLIARAAWYLRAHAQQRLKAVA